MAINPENALSISLSSMADPQLSQPAATEAQPASELTAMVVGIYGISGSGKTFLLHHLGRQLGEKEFKFYEGSEMINTVVPGGLDAFHMMEEQDRAQWRQSAIDTIGKESAYSGKVAVVAGHVMFWPEEQEAGQLVFTENDSKVFKYILYLDTPVEIVAQHRLDDTERGRPSVSVSHLRKWQQEEKTHLRDLCRRNSILLSLVSPGPMLLEKVSMLLQNFKSHTEEYNLSRAKSRLDDPVVAGKGELKTLLVLDADRTLAAEDTGALFWQRLSHSQPSEYNSSTLKSLFSSPLGYSFTAFRQATLLYEEAANDEVFETLCQDVALAVTLHPHFVLLLRLVAEQKHVGAVVVTCGLRRVWELVLKREGLSETVKVIGGGRVADDLVVTGAVKATLVANLQEAHHMYVWAFGDSPLDIGMLRKADRAIVVVGEEQTRSTTMDVALTNAIDYGGLRAHQVLLPSSASPRLDTNKLPIIKLTDPDFLASLLSDQSTHSLQVLCATDKSAAKLLATRMRNAAVAGPDLREAHRRVGWYLAIEFVADVIGLEECPIRHVLGRETEGHQLLHEQQTTIVALMRGGEPMALGVSDAFPLAMFVHADDADDVELHHLKGQLTVILVDSVVNTGKTIVEFVEHVRDLCPNIRIVVVAGVVQAQCVSEDGLKKTLAHHLPIHLVALRLSDTKFTGTGTSDTGNRLFNTTHLR